jgi:hypothetical protein
MARRSDSNFAKSLEHAILQNFVLSRRQRIDSESHICSRHTNKIVPTGNKFVAEFQMQVGNVPGERIRVQVVRMEDGVAITASNMGRDGTAEQRSVCCRAKNGSRLACSLYPSHQECSRGAGRWEICGQARSSLPGQMASCNQ